MSRWKLEAIVKADEWEPATDRFRLDGPKEDGLVVNLDTYLYLPNRWFVSREIKRLGPEFAEGWYRNKNNDQTYYLTREAPDDKTRRDTEWCLKKHQVWVYKYRAKTSPGMPPSLVSEGGTDWDTYHDQYEAI